MENMQAVINELYDNFTPEELEEIKSYQYTNEINIDESIERVKELDVEIERLKEIGDERIVKMKEEMKYKIDKLQRKRDWEISNITAIVYNSPDKHETKTQYKKTYVSGDVVLKKATVKLIKPELKEEVIKERLSGYAKTKTEIDWKSLKNDLVINNNNEVFSKSTGESLSDLIKIEQVPMKTEIK
ncbi:host-nuclease inhibitor Gam family protein [Brevibacillus laterosporus]|uniref:host-nuclease inhibitor Gam family protein n=1 Tax=Brevibacillus laterosporus TaxID=1465 RepID=UPI0018F87676|nr:host-nuclease inhibitor Gam family protein [Brevibacillus laterosporus]MBG9773031.1 hypothetical protein [Brevibacillus laterosporus]